MADYSQQWRHSLCLRNQAAIATVGIIPLGFLSHVVGNRFGSGKAFNSVLPLMVLICIGLALITRGASGCLELSSMWQELRLLVVLQRVSIELRCAL